MTISTQIKIVQTKKVASTETTTTTSIGTGVDANVRPQVQILKSAPLPRIQTRRKLR